LQKNGVFLEKLAKKACRLAIIAPLPLSTRRLSRIGARRAADDRAHN
jgi:hypothetical protein